MLLHTNTIFFFFFFSLQSGTQDGASSRRTRAISYDVQVQAFCETKSSLRGTVFILVVIYIVFSLAWSGTGVFGVGGTNIRTTGGSYVGGVFFA